MDFDKLYPARFMKAGEFEGKDVTLTITDVKVEELEGATGKKGKGIVGFVSASGTKKELVLNRTNGECIKAMFGRDTKDWIGKRVTLYPATITDSFTDEPTLAIRVRGSPDIAADKSFSAKIGRKQGNFTLRKPATKGAAKPAAAPPPSGEMSDDEKAQALADEQAQS